MLGEHKSLAWNPHDPLIRAASGGGREEVGPTCDVRTDNREFPGIELKDVRAPLASGGLCSVGVRVRAESFVEHEICVTVVA